MFNKTYLQILLLIRRMDIKVSKAVSIKNENSKRQINPATND